MIDYEPDYVYMIPVAYNSKEIFYEDLKTVPARIRGAFLTDEEKKDKIDFKFIDSENKVIYEASGNAKIFDFVVNTPGKYKIVFDNSFLNKDIKITFTMNSDQNPILKKDNLTFTESKLDTLIDFIKKFNLEFRFSRNSHKEEFSSKII